MKVYSRPPAPTVERGLVRLLRAAFPLADAIPRAVRDVDPQILLTASSVPGAPAGILTVETPVAVTLTAREWLLIGQALQDAEPYPLRVDSGFLSVGPIAEPVVFTLGHHARPLFAAIVAAEIRAARISDLTGRPCKCAGAIRPNVDAPSYEWWVPPAPGKRSWQPVPANLEGMAEALPVTRYRLMWDEALEAVQLLGGGE